MAYEKFGGFGRPPAATHTGNGAATEPVVDVHPDGVMGDVMGQQEPNPYAEAPAQEYAPPQYGQPLYGAPQEAPQAIQHPGFQGSMPWQDPVTQGSFKGEKGRKMIRTLVSAGIGAAVGAWLAYKWATTQKKK